MAKKPLPKRSKPIDPFLTFCNGRAFNVSARVLSEQKPFKLFDTPTLMCEVFSLELHLKCLHHIRRRYPIGHDTKLLFESLSEADRKKIARIYEQLLTESKQDVPTELSGITFDIDSVLIRSRRFFKAVRYWHERVLPDADIKGFVSNAGIGPLSYAVIQRILELRPDWNAKEMRKNFPRVFDQIAPQPK